MLVRRLDAFDLLEYLLLLDEEEENGSPQKIHHHLISGVEAEELPRTESKGGNF